MRQTILTISRWHYWKIFCLWLLIFASYRKIGFHCRAVRLCLDAVVTDNLRVTVATHNLKSAELALSQVQSNPILKSGVNFAQINGLGDHISMALSLQGCQVLKLLPCGTVDEVLPWLSRYLFFFIAIMIKYWIFTGTHNRSQKFQKWMGFSLSSCLILGARAWIHPTFNALKASALTSRFDWSAFGSILNFARRTKFKIEANGHQSKLTP